jgi:hypothetical protein
MIKALANIKFPLRLEEKVHHNEAVPLWYGFKEEPQPKAVIC